MIRFPEPFNYVSRSCWDEIHTTNWRRAYIIAHRRAGKTFSLSAETIKRAYNIDTNTFPNPQYLFLSPLAEQTEANILNMAQLQASAYIKDWRPQERALVLHNGSTIWFGGARTAEKFRGRYLDGVIVDEASEISDYILNDILHFCLLDRKGWLALCGTARSDDDYRLYRGYKAALAPDSGFDLVKKIGVLESNVLEECYHLDPATEKQRFINNALATGSTYPQALQSWMCEMECDFSFIDEGKPNMNALFYNELNNLFASQPARLTAVPSVPDQTAVFDLASGGGRDYTTAVLLTPDLNVSAITFSNQHTMAEWIDTLKAANVNTVVLPFDAKQRNRDTGISTIDFMASAGFRVIVLKRMLHQEQEENARWLLNYCRFDYNNCVDALRELGKFTEWNAKHKLPQDITSAICYAGQFARKKGLKLERRKALFDPATQRKRVLENPNEQSNLMIGLNGGIFG